MLLVYLNVLGGVQSVGHIDEEVLEVGDQSVGGGGLALSNNLEGFDFDSWEFEIFLQVIK